MKTRTFELGCVKGCGQNMTAAREDAINKAGRALRVVDSYTPNMVSLAGFICLVYPMVNEDGSVSYGYTNPRTLAELGTGTDLVRRVGSAGYWPDATRACSAALSHIIQNLPEIPATLPAELHPDDVSMLETLRNRWLAVA